MGRHRSWALHGHFYLCPLLRDLGLQAQQQIIVHGFWHRCHLELQYLPFSQLHQAPTRPGWSHPRGHQALYHIDHLPSRILSLPSQVVQEGSEVPRLHLLTASPHHVWAAATLTCGLIALGIQGATHVAVTGTTAQHVMAQAPVARQAAVTATSGH